MPGFPVLLHLLELAQTHVHWAGDAIQPFHSLLPPYPSVFNLSQHQVFFPNQSAFHIRCPKYWSLSISSYIEYSGLISFRIDWFDLLAVQGTLKSLLQPHNLKASFKSRFPQSKEIMHVRFLAFMCALMVKHLPTMWETGVQSLGWEDLLEEEMATHSSILTWKIPWTEEPGSPWGCKELDTTEQFSFFFTFTQFSLSFTFTQWIIVVVVFEDCGDIRMGET